MMRKETAAEPPLWSLGLSARALSRVNWHCLVELWGRMRCKEMHVAPYMTMKSCWQKKLSGKAKLKLANYKSRLNINSLQKDTRLCFTRGETGKHCPYFESVPHSVNKVLLKHSHAHLFTCGLWLLHVTIVGTTGFIWPPKPQIFTVWPFTEKVCQPWI